MIACTGGRDAAGKDRICQWWSSPVKSWIGFQVWCEWLSCESDREQLCRWRGPSPCWGGGMGLECHTWIQQSNRSSSLIKNRKSFLFFIFNNATLELRAPPITYCVMLPLLKFMEPFLLVWWGSDVITECIRTHKGEEYCWAVNSADCIKQMSEPGMMKCVRTAAEKKKNQTLHTKLIKFGSFSLLSRAVHLMLCSWISGADFLVFHYVKNCFLLFLIFSIRDFRWNSFILSVQIYLSLFLTITTIRYTLSVPGWTHFSLQNLNPLCHRFN